MILKKASREIAIKMYREYYHLLKYGIDGYHERTMVDGDSYLLFDNEVKGIISIHEERGLTGFYILDQFLYEYSTILSFVLALPEVTNIMFSTKDTLFTEEITRRQYKTEIQAYNFLLDEELETDYKMELATIDDIELYKTTFGDFIKDYEIKIQNKELYIKYDSKGEFISLGAYDPMILNPKRACIAMKVVESQRQKGYGVKTILFLNQILKEKNMIPNARCWVKNKPSKKTLLKSGFKVSNLLLRVDSLEVYND